MIENGHVPVSLRPRVGAVVLHHWYFFHRDFSSSVQGWADIVAAWPADVRLALVDGCRDGDSGRVDEEVSAAAKVFQLRSDHLERILDRHRRAGSKAPLQRLAPLLWEWCGRTEPEPERSPLAPDLCREMARPRLPDRQPSTESAELAAFLARQAGFFSAYPDSLAQLWEPAANAWQILLLLASAPGADLVPNLRHLVALVPERQRLAQHLAQQKQEGCRHRRFAVATLDFQSRKYAEKPGLWRNEYAGSILWAAFSGVPFAKQGNLGLALDAYAGSGHAHARGRIKLAQTYLGSYRDAERREAFRRISHGVVIRMAKECGLRQFEIQRLVHDELTGSGTRRTPDSPAAGTAPVAVARAGKGFQTAWWFRAYLHELQDLGGGDVLLDEIG